MQFSLILATLGRSEEVALFLRSLNEQDFDLQQVEVIVVDQNTSIDLAPLLAECGLPHLQHIRLDRAGLSYARNRGLELARGRWVAFPDDDCLFYPNTLSTAAAFFAKHPQVRVLKGRIWDRQTQTNIIRNWPAEAHTITKSNFYSHSSGITLFYQHGPERFDERLGVGAPFGSNEDADFILRFLQAGHSIEYDPQLEVWHPLPGTVPAHKAFGYGLGFGALARKHQLWTLLIQALFFHALKGALALVRGNLPEAQSRYQAFAGRIAGFVRWPSIKPNSL